MLESKNKKRSHSLKLGGVSGPSLGGMEVSSEHLLAAKHSPRLIVERIRFFKLLASGACQPPDTSLRVNGVKQSTSNDPTSNQNKAVCIRTSGEAAWGNGSEKSKNHPPSQLSLSILRQQEVEAERPSSKKLRFRTPRASVDEGNSSAHDVESNPRKFSQMPRRGILTRNATLLPCSSEVALIESQSSTPSNAALARRSSMAQRRQSNTQLAQKVVGRKHSTTLVPLTAAQIYLVRSLWRQIYLSKGPTLIGTTLVQRLLFKCPVLKDQFRECPFPAGYPNRDSFTKEHAKQIAELVNRVVESLDDLEAVSAQLEHVGKIHAHLLSGDSLSRRSLGKMWNAAAETFIDCTLEWGDKRCRSETMRKAWALLISYMVERIKQGNWEERKQLLAMRSTIISLERVVITPNST